MDDDGIAVGEHIRIKVKVTIKGDEMTVDLSEVAKQVRGAYNSRAGVSGTQVGFKTLICPTWFPVNDGSFKPLKVILPEGTVVSAVKPAPMYVWMTIPMTIADTMWKALAPAMPDRIAAGHFTDLYASNIFAVDPISKAPIVKSRSVGNAGRPGAGGWGAKHNEDGMSATICLNDGDTHNYPIEVMEAEDDCGILLRWELRQDSGGPGKCRGGLGTETEAVYFKEVKIACHAERSLCAPWGIFGGKPALANALTLGTPKAEVKGIDTSSREILRVPLKYKHYPNRKQPNIKIHTMVYPAGTRVIRRTGGGGGFGNPLDRDLDRVQRDVLEGYISIRGARDYGVIIKPSSLRVDVPKTEKLRPRLRKQ
jgi:N-methylhydantoinase B